MAKKTPIEKERMLYETYLDLYYADHDYGVMIEEMAETLKALRATKRKTAKLFEKCRQQYIDIYGIKPLNPKR